MPPGKEAAKKVARLAVTPLLDVPTLPGGRFGRLVEQAIEGSTSPIGLVSTALLPVTGGTSLGLRGAAGVGARLATRGLAEVGTSAAGGLAAQEAARHVQNAPGVLKYGAPLVAGFAGSAGASAGFTRGPRALMAANSLDDSAALARRAGPRETSTLGAIRRLNPVAVTEFIPQPRMPVGVRADAAVVAGKRWFHGSQSDLTPETLNSQSTSVDGLFGRGLYLTDDPRIAGGYAALGRSADATGTAKVYEASVAPSRILDLDLPFDGEFHAVINDFQSARPYENDDVRKWVTDYTNNRLGAAAKSGLPFTRGDAMEMVLEYGKNVAQPTSPEVNDALRGALMARGYDAMTHTGGRRVVKGKVDEHQVLILLRPESGGVSGFVRRSPDDAVAQFNRTTTTIPTPGAVERIPDRGVYVRPRRLTGDDHRKQATR